MKKAPPTRENLVNMYERQRMSTRAVGKEIGLDHKGVLRWLEKYEIPRRMSGRSLAARGIEKPSRAELARMIHEEHLGYRGVAARYGVDYTAIARWLDEHGIPRPDPVVTRRRGVPLTPPTADELRSRYEGGRSMESIAKEFGVGEITIGRLCRDYGIDVKVGGWQSGRRWACSDGHEVRSSYEQRVDNWLSAHRLEHELEPQLPFDRRLRSDFLVKGAYIEVWGVRKVPAYAERRKRKTALYRQHGFALIELTPSSFARGTWVQRVAQLLPGGALDA